jgi:hypothetical protein
VCVRCVELGRACEVGEVFLVGLEDVRGTVWEICEACVRRWFRVCPWDCLGNL